MAQPESVIPPGRPLTIVASIGENNELGKEGDLCWHIREDLRHFKELTLGGAVIMGRKTWESLPKKPLPGRTNIVISSKEPAGEEAGVCFHARSLEEAVSTAASQNASGQIFIIGGASVYRQAMPAATCLELTKIHAADTDADTFFPNIDEGEWRVEKESEIMTAPDGLKFQYITYRRRE